MPEAVALRGVVKWFNKDKGYGFIVGPADMLDVFIHADQLRTSGIDRCLREGEEVTFVPVKGKKGTFATSLQVIVP